MGGLIKEIGANRWKYYTVVMILLSGLGTYVVMGVRLERFVIYPLFIGLVIALAFVLRLNKIIFILGLPLFFSVLVMIVLDSFSFGRERQVSLAASLDNILQPALLACLKSLQLKLFLNWGLPVLVLAAL